MGGGTRQEIREQCRGDRCRQRDKDWNGLGGYERSWGDETEEGGGGLKTGLPLSPSDFS